MAPYVENKLERKKRFAVGGALQQAPIQRKTILLWLLPLCGVEPVRAGMVTSAEAHLWSSYRESALIVGLGTFDRDACYLSDWRDTQNSERMASI